MKNLVYALAALQPVSVAAGAVLGYLFGPKVVEYAVASVSKVYGDLSGFVKSVIAKL